MMVPRKSFDEAVDVIMRYGSRGVADEAREYVEKKIRSPISWTTCIRPTC